MQLWDIVPALDLTAFARELYPDAEPNSLNRFLPDRQIRGIKSQVARSTRTRTTARYRSYNAETPIGQRPETVVQTEVTLPPVGQKLPITEWERLWLEFATNGGNAGAVSNIVAAVYDDVQNNIEAIRNRLELARGQLLTTGAFTLTAENGLTLEADFGMVASHLPQVAKAWSDPTALALSDELAWRRLIATDSGKQVTAIVTSETNIADLARNDEYRSAYWGGNAVASPVLNLAQLNSVRADNGLTGIQTYDHALDVGGVLTDVIPDDRWIMLAGAPGETQFGITAESLELVGSNAVDFTVADAPGIFAAAYKQADPVTGWTKATAVAMPVLADVNAIVSARIAV